MKKILTLISLATFVLLGATSCIQEIDPQSSTVTTEQVSSAPGAYDNFVSAITSSLCGQFTYSGSSWYAYDFGYPQFYIERDVMGQDILPATTDHWFMNWYSCAVTLGATYAVAQVPWTYYYKWIKNCNQVIALAGKTPTEAQKPGLGIAYAMRAMFYMDIARMYAPKTYASDKSAETVPIIKESTTKEELAHNPRATNEKIWEFILSDLDEAEKNIAGYQRSDKYTPDISVVYGLKARAYLTMEDWVNAAKYANLAQKGYAIMDKDTYTSRSIGFNQPNSSWMFCLKYKEEDPNIRDNDGDCSWASFMCLEVNSTGCGYATNYGQPLLIDRHLYETIPSTDFRKNCFVDFAIDGLADETAQVEALKSYSDYPEGIYGTGHTIGGVGGLSVKFRVIGDQAGRENQHLGFAVSVPLMRVEEMKLIEAEATGMQPGKENEGIALLTAFAKTRDASYTYGTHNEAYGNATTSKFQNEVLWERRVELWGEGFATFDIKRLNKGIIRSYENTNHLELYRWNTTEPAAWMTLCFPQTETNYNLDCNKNPTPISPKGDSEKYVW